MTSCQKRDCRYGRGGHFGDHELFAKETFVIHRTKGDCLSKWGFDDNYADSCLFDKTHERFLCSACAASTPSLGSCKLCDRLLYNSHIQFGLGDLYCGLCVPYIMDVNLYLQLSDDAQVTYSDNCLTAAVVEAIENGKDPWHTDAVFEREADRIVLIRMVQLAISEACEARESRGREATSAWLRDARAVAATLQVEVDDAQRIMKEFEDWPEHIPTYVLSSRAELVIWLLRQRC